MTIDYDMSRIDKTLDIPTICKLINFKRQLATIQKVTNMRINMQKPIVTHESFATQINS